MTVTVRNKADHTQKVTYREVSQIIILDLDGRKDGYEDIESSVAFVLDMPKTGTATFDYYNWIYQIEKDY